MASLSELVDYAKAKQPRNGLAEVAAHFIEGASQGYDSGLKAKMDKYDQILKAAQAMKAQEEANLLKVQNEALQSLLNTGKATGSIPLTAGEDINGRVVTQKNMGEDSSTPPNSMARLATLFQPPAGMQPKSMTIKLPGKMGGISYATPKTETPGKPRTPRQPDPLAIEKEDRIVWDKATKRALEMAQNENPLATFEDSKKYLRTAFQTLGKDPDKYLKNSPLLAPPPAVAAATSDPWGLLKK